MNNYKLVKNTEWKEVEINGEQKEIPVTWDFKTLRSISYVTDGTHSSPKIVENSDFYYLTVKDLDWGGNINFKGAARISEENYLKLVKGKCAPNKDDILLSKDGTVGKVAIFSSNLKTVILSSLAIIRFANLNPKYGYFFFKHDYTKNNLFNLKSGNAIQRIVLKQLNEFDFFFPNNSDQSSISSILSHQESIIQDIESIISKYESRLNYLSEELLSGRLRVKEVEGQMQIYKNPDDNWKEVEVNGEMKEIPSDWDIASIENSIEMETHTKNSQILNGSILNSGTIPVIGQEVEFISGYTNNVKPLLATKDNPTIIFGDHSCTLKLITFDYVLGGDGTKVFKGNNKVQTNFLFYSIKDLNFHTDGYKRHFSILKEKLINIPPIKTQLSISSILSQQEVLIAQQKELLVKEKQKFSWLLDNLLSGKYIILKKE